MDPTAIGRTPPSFFLMAVRLAPSNACLACSGISYAMATFHSSVSALSSLRPASAVYLTTSCRRCKGRNPSRPAAEPGAVALMAAKTSVSTTMRRFWSGTGGAGMSSLGAAGGCLERRASATSCLGGMTLSEVVRSRRAARMSPSAHFFWTRLMRESAIDPVAALGQFLVAVSLEGVGSACSARGLWYMNEKRRHQARGVRCSRAAVMALERSEATR